MKLKKSASKEECSICGGKFAKLRLHYRENHGIQVGLHEREMIKPSVNKCQKCGLEFRFKGSLSRHLRRVHNHDRKQDIDSGGMDLFYKCAECDERFSNLRNMRRHSKDEHPKTIVEPSLIVKKFTRGIMIPQIMSRRKSYIKANLLRKVSEVFVMRS